MPCKLLSGEHLEAQLAVAICWHSDDWQATADLIRRVADLAALKFEGFSGPDLWGVCDAIENLPCDLTPELELVGSALSEYLAGFE